MQLIEKNFEILKEPKVKTFNDRIDAIGDKFFKGYQKYAECIDILIELMEVKNEVLKEYSKNDYVYYEILGDAILNILIPLDELIKYYETHQKLL
jgi:hypothetical protein